MDYIMDFDDGQVLVSGEGEVTTLQGERFAWRDKKVKTVRLAELYDKAGYPDYAGRARACATWLQYGVGRDGEKTLQAANFCHLRLCPMCLARRARRSAFKLSRVLDMVEDAHSAKFLFLTLTVRNVPGCELGAALGQLTDAWDRFLKQRQIGRSVKGWFRAVEITRGNGVRKADKGYHPHIHAILAVEADYFSRESRKSGKYLNQSDLIGRWQQALRVDYRPSVRIQVTKARAGTGEAVMSAGGRAALEAAKYVVKDSDYIDPELSEDKAVEIVKDYTDALWRRRLMAFGGWLKEVAKQLDAVDLEDGDLVRVDDTVRDDVADLIETYNWHFGAGDYILASREVNPLKIERNSADGV